ncbi:RNAse H domain protein, YqgF family [Aeromicrobium marinum DSM 15272]|uniref:Putative pre-16S rRNA nuclease n=1 Tax=Aeromicrobium marinum DSM 15272 TaxID=585531 RepID=E2S9F5_9ACTN|nr:RNAse H domain protein, YqgF family [Aeromicrobium marinum DSM 15272]
MDVGDVRIGVAMCDPDGMIATPVETVPAGPAAHARLLQIASEIEVVEIVVGLPLSLSGREGPAAGKVRAFVQVLAAMSDRPVRLVDERLSTVTAGSQLRDSGRTGRGTRRVIDQAAAVVILQNALDAERTRGHAPGELVVVGEPTEGEA